MPLTIRLPCANEVSNRALAQRLQAVGEARATQALVACLGCLRDADLAVPLTYISALVTSPPGKQFAAQFIEAGGAAPAAMRRHAAEPHPGPAPGAPKCTSDSGAQRLLMDRVSIAKAGPVGTLTHAGCLSKSPPPEACTLPGRLLAAEQAPSVLVPALLCYGQLARLSREHYPLLAQARTSQALPMELSQPPAGEAGASPGHDGHASPPDALPEHLRLLTSTRMVS